MLSASDPRLLHDNQAMRELHNRVAVFTGAASGIGFAIVEAFVAERMKVVMADLDGDRLEAEADRLRRAGGEVVRLRSTSPTRTMWNVRAVGPRAVRGPPRGREQRRHRQSRATPGSVARRVAAGGRRGPLGSHPWRAHLRATHPGDRRRGPHRERGLHGGGLAARSPGPLHRGQARRARADRRLGRRVRVAGCPGRSQRRDPRHGANRDEPDRDD